MPRAALPGRLNWQLGRVIELVQETERSRSIVLELSGWPGHRAGQHVDLRLTAGDGHQAQRSYSIASGPEDGYLVLTAERLDDGEISPFLVDELRVGDELELRGPVGGYFVWDDTVTRPVLLVAGGSGIVPFRSMLRQCATTSSDAVVRLLYSASSLDELIYREELLRLAAYDEVDIRFALTREWPHGWRGHRGAVDRRLLEEVSWSPAERQLSFICGPSCFVDTMVNALVANGHRPAQIKTERFGRPADPMQALDGNAIAGPCSRSSGTI